VSAPAQPKFTLPRPEALGVATSLNVPAATAPAPAKVDWNDIQARLVRLNVVEYQKAPAPTGGIQVTLGIPTANPSQRQRFQAQGNTEAAALLVALQQAEAQRRGQ
jgi:hypothetical protein